MTYQQLAYLHLATILPAFLIGTFLLLRRKGTALHKALGRSYLLLILATGVITLFMPAQVGPSLLGHFGFIHTFSLLVFYSVPAAYIAARRGDIKTHRGNMIGLYVGGIIVAGSFALMPGRMLNEMLFK
ncbi:MAG: DUF2306 domain-containing protein [Gammaproteobacteria bacterium]|nr:DUF2306 domain-containing protein [Gammaproteobacteria bacterium]